MAITPVDFQRREPRDPQRTTTASFNLLLEQSRQSAQTFLKTGAGRVPIVQTRNLTILPCKNTSDADLTPGQILGIDDILIAPADNESEFEFHPGISGVAPTVADHIGKFVVAIEAIGKTKGVGQVAVAGVVPARVYVNAFDDKYCDVIDVQTVDDEDCHLGSGSSGAQILWWEATSSDDEDTIVWAIVRLGASSSLTPYILKTTLAPGATATGVPIVFDTSAHTWTEPADYTTNSETVYNDHGAFRCIGHDNAISGEFGAIVMVDANKVVVSALKQQARMIRGAATVDGSKNLTGITSPVSMDSGQLPSGTIPITATGWTTNSGATVILLWDETSATYYPVDAVCKT